MSSQKQQQIRRVVIKIGSGVISTEEGLDRQQLDALTQQICTLRKQGLELVMVSSGAVAAGKTALDIRNRPATIPQKQAAAAVGQPRVMRAYKEIFQQQGLNAAQVLLTRDDLSHRRRYLNAHNTLETLLEYGITPIVNENDTVVVEEIRFGDNDNLSALVAGLIEADLLLILSDVDGFYTSNPSSNPEARLLSQIPQITDKVLQMADGTEGALGTGGMLTKVQAAQHAAIAGIPTRIVNGRCDQVLLRLFSGEQLGTLFLAADTHLNARKRWILSLPIDGRLLLDEGAVTALVERGKSLLPSGIQQLDGHFERGDVVELCAPDGQAIAVGMASYNHQELQQIRGHRCAEIKSILGYSYRDEAIHRDYLVLLRDRNRE